MAAQQQYPAAFKHSSFFGLIGVAQEDITPPIGIYARNWGAAEHDAADGIHRPLMLTCFIFQTSKAEKPLVLIAADLCVWRDAEDEKAFRGEILSALSVEPAQLMFCLSHTHAAPSIHKEDAAKPGGQFIEPYLEEIRNKTIRAAKKALSAAVSATLTWHYGKCALAANRDLPVLNSENYLTGFNPRKEADDTLLVGRITEEDTGRTIGTIVNYACHPTTLAWENRLISPDYVGAMREIVESKFLAPCLFLQGASGELAPAEQYVGDIEVAESHGRQLGYAVLSVLEAMLPPKIELSFDNVVKSAAPLGVWKKSANQPSTLLSADMREVEIMLKLPSLAEIERQYRECEDRILKELLYRKLGFRKAFKDTGIALIPAWVWRLGDSYFIGQPGEAYSVFQRELRQQLAPHAVAVINMVNGTAGYFPPKDLYDKKIYQVWHSSYAVGSLERLMEAALTAAKKADNNPC